MSNIGRTADGFFTVTMKELKRDPTLMREFADCYVGVFNATGEGDWAEQWTAEKAFHKLFVEPQDLDDTTFVTGRAVSGQLAGFAFVSVAPSRTALQPRDLPPGLQDPARCAAICAAIEADVGDAPTVYHREFGMRPEFRGGLGPVLQLLADPTEAAVKDTQAAFAFCWTRRQSRVFPIISAIGVREVYTFHDPDDHVIMGMEAPGFIRELRRPPAEIASLLAKSSPASPKKI